MVNYVPSGYFFIASQFNGKVLDVEKASTKDGAKICVWAKKDTDSDNQQWEYRNGHLINKYSGKALDIKGGKIKHDTRIVQEDIKEASEEADSQRWLIDPQYYIHTAADTSLVLDIRGAEDEDGAEVILYEKREGTASSNQRWNLIPAN
ncbi:carbohydrate-binding module family 13 protein [Phycomyces blakesleeanus]|uniref:Carbohydrate-binding module family 13 protein n=2 Tax=Phycomyces blakesleeanus TaxID=4837 RepID=A0A162U1T8_PHYB8|nr:carbohydrate-binding module family 13 protein [Phycomyces blakesleeanus NRRL 1555(-)]OAD72792.1 carbohydrate-binding module family 13 protein [Phycomyces blakesleeanus NRRL 1555(-)]|eukprot:XP_018290832.1 carbohydrate-binding module family 13 protein [Phycomyces blakesleeanus NRRL 1555(-)]